MKTYKIGNKAKCIIRSYSSGTIGEEHMIYANQPYTILDNVQASFNFEQNEKYSKTHFNEMAFVEDNLTEIKISNVELTNKILNLICLKNESKLCHITENLNSDDQKKIFLSYPSNEIYQVFIYNDNGELENAYDIINDNSIIVEKANSNYLICYSYEASSLNSLSYKFEKNKNCYLTLDFILIGNSDDETKNSYIHINKCALSIDKNMYFNNQSNAVDLRFLVIDDHESYITLE